VDGVDVPEPTLWLAVRVELAPHAVTIGHGSGAAAAQDHALHAPPGLVGEILEKQRAHRPPEADVEFGHLALGEGNHPHPGELRLLVERRDMFLVAADAIEALREDDIDTAGAHRLEEGLVAWAVQIGA
jgi:hypothetical protein